MVIETLTAMITNKRKAESARLIMLATKINQGQQTHGCLNWENNDRVQNIFAAGAIKLQKMTI